eukprot:415871-Amorphochlora_amoeboformis.AAC.1
MGTYKMFLQLAKDAFVVKILRKKRKNGEKLSQGVEGRNEKLRDNRIGGRSGNIRREIEFTSSQF